MPIIHLEPYSDELVDELWAFSGDYMNRMGKDALIKERARINKVAYRRLWEAGILLVVVARGDDGSPMGFMVIVLEHGIHYETVIATVHLYYAKEGCGSLAAKLLRFGERAAKENGANYLMTHARTGGIANEFFQRFGYIPKEVNYIKELL